MKKFFLFFIIMSITVSLFACNSVDNNSSNTTATSENEESYAPITNSSASDDVGDSSSKMPEENSGGTSSDSSSDASNGDTSNDISADTSDDVSDNQSGDISDNPTYVPSDRESMYYYDCTEFYENEKDYYARMFNPEPLNEIFKIDLIVTEPSEKFPYYKAMSEYPDKHTLSECSILMYPLEDLSTNALLPIRYLLSPAGCWLYDPASPLDEFMQIAICYQYKKEGVDVFLVADMVSDPPKDVETLCFNLYVCCKIDGYVFAIDTEIWPQDGVTISEKTEYGKTYSRWPTEEEYTKLKPMFENAEWKYDLLNIYDEKSELIALLKELATE